MEKFKKLWQEKNKKMENLVAFLIILVITLLMINTIIKEDDEEETEKYSGAELAIATSSTGNAASELEERLEKILSQIEGVGEVSVLITYSQSSTIVPMYNETTSKSVTEETDEGGGTRTIEAEDNEKSVVTRFRFESC